MVQRKAAQVTIAVAQRTQEVDRVPLAVVIAIVRQHGLIGIVVGRDHS